MGGRLEWYAAIFFLIATTSAVAGSRSPALEGLTAERFQLAQEKLASVHDNDPYAAERLRYIINKILAKAKKCSDAICRVGAENDINAINQAIIDADPSAAYWRDLKVCEDKECVDRLTGPSGTQSAATASAQTDSKKESEDQVGYRSDASSQPGVTSVDRTAVASPATAESDASINSNSLKNKDAPVSESRDVGIGSQSFGWIIGASILVIASWMFLSIKKCPACGKRGTIVRLQRELVDQHQGTRLKSLRSSTVHRSKDEYGYLRESGTSTTTYQVPVATVISNYVDTYQCKSCQAKYDRQKSETRDA